MNKKALKLIYKNVKVLYQIDTKFDNLKIFVWHYQ